MMSDSGVTIGLAGQGSFAGDPDELPAWYYPGCLPPPPGGPPDFIPDCESLTTAHFVIVGIIIPLGLAANILTLIVFITSRTFRRTTTGLYMMSLAIADSIYLIGDFIRWLNIADLDHLDWHIDFLNSVSFLCKMTMFLRYGGKLASALLTVVIAVDKFIAVTFPLKVSRISTLRIARITICAVFLISFGLGSFPFWTVGIVSGYWPSTCAILPNMDKTYKVLNWVVLRVGSLIMPGILIMICCTMIVVSLSKSKGKQRKLSVLSTASTGTGSEGSSSNLERQLSIMMLAVGVAFIVLNLPYTLTYYLKHSAVFGEPMPPVVHYRLFYADKITNIFVVINYAINPFLYPGFGSYFRRQLKLLFRCSPIQPGGSFRNAMEFSSLRSMRQRSTRGRGDITRQASNMSQSV